MRRLPYIYFPSQAVVKCYRNGGFSYHNQTDNGQVNEEITHRNGEEDEERDETDERQEDDCPILNFLDMLQNSAFVEGD